MIYKSKSKSSTPGVSMSNSPNPGIEMPNSTTIGHGVRIPFIQSCVDIGGIFIGEIFLNHSSKVRSSSIYSSMLASSTTQLIADAGMGTTRNCLQETRFPVVRQRKVYLPWELVVRPRQIALQVNSFFIFFNERCSSCNS